MSAEKHPSEGVLYVAFGSFYLLLAIHSAYTLKMRNSEISVCLVTNQKVTKVLVDGMLLFDKIIYHNSPDSENRNFKLSMDIYTPFEKTLFLDADTEVHGDLSPMFLFLNTVSLCVKSNCYPARKSQEIIIKNGSIQKLGLSEFNSGVIGFRTPHVHDFFLRWRAIYHDCLKCHGVTFDQMSFAQLLYESPIAFYPLGAIWNLKPDSLERQILIQSSCEVRILHYREPFKWPAVSRRLIETWSKATLRGAGEDLIKSIDQDISARLINQKKLSDARPKLRSAKKSRKVKTSGNLLYKRIGYWFKNLQSVRYLRSRMKANSVIRYYLGKM